jgi:hypothetical protein
MIATGERSPLEDRAWNIVTGRYYYDKALTNMTSVRESIKCRVISDFSLCVRLLEGMLIECMLIVELEVNIPTYDFHI